MVSVVRRSFLLFMVVVLLIGGFPGSVLAQGNIAKGRGTREMAPRPMRASAATASVSLNGGGDVLIGENFSFTVSFKNTGSTPGYGPFVDLVFPTNGADGNANQAVQDGIEFISAATLGYTFSAAQNTLKVQPFPAPTGGATCVEHPWARQTNGELVEVCGPSGDTLVSLRLPYGGVVPGQPIANITVNALLSNLADVDTTLNIRSRGGFLYGNDSLDNWCCGDGPIISNPSTNSGSWPGTPFTPKVFTFDKTYSGPDNVQDETATGPNFIRQYTLMVNIATGQTITDVNVTDQLPDNEQYVSLDTGATTGGYTITSVPSTTAPGGLLTLRYGSATGTASTADLQVVFNFYIPRLDAANAAVINPVSGNTVTSENPAWMTASWVPGDGRDAEQELESDSICIPGGVCQPLHTLEDKAIAIQKSVVNLTDNNPSPGDIFEYTLTFQVSDYFAFDTVTLTDVISDGQRVFGNFVPTMQFSGNGYNLPTAVIAAANRDVSCNYTGGPGPECSINNPAGNDGTTSLIVRISNELISRGQNGRLIGGCVNPAGGNLPVCSAGSRGDGPTTGVIKFQAVLQEDFANDFPSGDSSVDQGDEFTDEATISGRVLNNNSFAGQQLEDDDATAAFTIARDGLTKALYAINGDPNPSNWQRQGSDVAVKPADTVTYRISYDLNTSDVEDLVLEDYLPLPVFFVNDPNTDGTAGPVFVFDDVVSGAVPAVGHAQFGPSDTFRTYSGIVPTLGRDGARNILRFTYGDYDNDQNQSTMVDLLFTLQVSSKPFADQSFIANQAHHAEGSTNNGSFAQDALQWFILTQPALATTKGIIWTDSPSALLDPLPAGPVGFLPPSSEPRWSGTINSAGLAAYPIDSNITGVRPGNVVSFGIVIENKGTSLKGAFDIVINDSIPNIYTIPAGGPNVQIYYGDGTGPIDMEVDGVVQQSDCIGGWPGNPCGPDRLANTPDDLFGRGIKLVDPVGQGVCDAYNPNLGNNVILVTYDLLVKDNLQVGTYTNTGRITNYSGDQGGDDHTGGSVTWGHRTHDTAQASWISAKRLAETGFAPGIVTKLPQQPVDSGYNAIPGLRLEIPTLNVNLPVIGIPNTDTGWNLTWLSNQAGYLQGTTPPGVVGNTVLTSHVYLADGSPGPFVKLGSLRWGQTIILHADGYRYTYQVRENQVISPTNFTVFREDGYAWLTLITCKDYSAVSKSYRYRVAVRAVLLKVERE